MKVQEVEEKDIKAIRKIEKEYYEGYSCPEDILRSWIRKSKGNFLIAKDEKSRPIAFLFFERTNQLKPLPFIHKPQKQFGKYIYISEIGILNGYKKTQILEKLFQELLSRMRDEKGIIWVTGSKSKHDKFELKLIKRYKFKRLKRITRWEVYPNHFVNDHWVWSKKLK